MDNSSIFIKNPKVVATEFFISLMNTILFAIISTFVLVKIKANLEVSAILTIVAFAFCFWLRTVNWAIFIYRTQRVT